MRLTVGLAPAQDLREEGSLARATRLGEDGMFLSIRGTDKPAHQPEPETLGAANQVIRHFSQGKSKGLGWRRKRSARKG